jgi:3-deoxy-7-phosphoheptulonate synthase
VPVLRERTHLPVIVDPSHAAGDWHYVTPLALAARAVACDGIMVEIHPDRSAALSDREQALSFEQFAELMELLRVPPARRDGVPAGGLAATAGVPLGGAAAAPAMSWAAAPLGSPPPAGC